ncbi:hypothetical protein DV096_15650 [Bradymonadaceae bacterium TMQ3]|nr:hypothetical protein DV096_15650 [Bradymonadaceae bacterium TMQ3]
MMTPHLPAPPHHLALLLALLLSTACATAPDANQDTESDGTQGKITLNEDPELRAIAQRSLEFHKPALQACFDDWLETIDRADYTDRTYFRFQFHLLLDARYKRTRLAYVSASNNDTRAVQTCIENHLQTRLVSSPDATPSTYIPLAVTMIGFGTTDHKESFANTLTTFGTPRDLEEFPAEVPLPQNDFHQALSNNPHRLQTCHQAQLNALDGHPLQGTFIQNTIHIHPDGHVTYIESKSIPSNKDELLNCFITILAELTFPEAEDTNYRIFTLPIILDPYNPGQGAHVSLTPAP